MPSIGDLVLADAQERLRDRINERSMPLGWAIFHCDGSVNAEYQLQKDDEARIFPDDDAVWDHVCYEADKNPGGLEAEALDWLKRNSPDEYRYIMAAAPRGCLPLS
ncbi:protein of unknown function [Pseudorhizobium banfieldiae]|uniref:Uncharacterized protein n=1 Tax=Pseudorhizobium banfieldiae TaxID=1125847 RepID=L0NDF1_9HYPH|nr:hypothetical protein [Pseudorhizobium banfieldiae]CAD6606090.1 hypothetical protein RNT25_01782 [arsenite-oxidising bacterium NT-25]CCF19128.1 protein of unknown function [Pseudorhizobium banfieldiae]